MRALAAILLLLALAACAATEPPAPPPAPPLPPWAVPVDQLGNPWPEECRRDLAAETAYVPIFSVPRESMGRAPDGRSYDGLTYTFGVRGDELITIADDLYGWRLIYVMHHERCHVVAGAWHA